MAGFGWRLAVASAIGSSHIEVGLPCQDASTQRVVRPPRGGQIFVCAVCDGAGSAAFSDIGAKTASETFVSAVERYLMDGGQLSDVDRVVAASWVREAASAVRAVARLEGNSEKEYSSTLLAAIVGTHCAAFLQIGDGAIVVSHGAADGWSWVFWPFHGEYANQTVFLLSMDALERMEFEFAPRRIDALSIFSDGIERMVLNTKTKEVNNEFFDQMLRPVVSSPKTGLDESLSSALASYLGSRTVNSRTTDDKTLVLATRRARPDANDVD